MIWHSSFTKHLSTLIVLFLLLITHGSLQADPVSVVSFVSPDGTNYLYDLAITNNTAADPYASLASVDVSLPVGSVIGNATAPAGNGATTDPSGDLVEFSSNSLSGFPVGAAVDGFQFVSPAQFASLSFTANYLDSSETKVTTFMGITSPQAAAAVPEPATLGLLAGASLFLFGRRFLQAR